MKMMHQLSYVLLWAGGLNWGLVGLFNYNLVESMLPGIATLVYSLVGLAALYTLFTHKSYCKVCGDMKGMK